MKNKYLSLASLITISIMLPILTLAITGGTVPTPNEMGFQQNPPVTSVEDAAGKVALVVRWTYTIFFILAAFFLLLAAFKYLTAGHTPANIEVAKKMIIYAAVAIAVAFLSIGFESIVKNFLSPGGSGVQGSTQYGVEEQYNQLPK